MLTGAPIQFSTDNKDCMKLLKVFFYILIPAYLIYDIIAGVSFFLDEDVADSWKDFYLILLFVIVYHLFIISLGLYSIYAFVKKKRDTIFNVMHFMIYALVYRFLVVLINPLLKPYELIPLILTIFLFVFVCISVKLKELFPKETRKTSNFTWGLFYCSIFVPLFLFFLGLFQMAINMSI